MKKVGDRDASDEFPQEVKDAVLAESGGQCQCEAMACGHFIERCTNTANDMEMQFHHITPVAAGGDNTKGNCQYLCIYCHDVVHGTVPKDEAEQQKRYSK